MGKPKLGDAVGNSIRYIDGRVYELRRHGYYGGCGRCVGCHSSGSHIRGSRTQSECQAMCDRFRRNNEKKNCWSRGLSGVAFSELAPNGLPVEHGREPMP